MSNANFCPECGNPIEEGSLFCNECGASIQDETPTQPAVQSEATPSTPSSKHNGEVIGAGARANITGGVHTSHNTMQKVNTTNVDQSSTVNNNTTIVMSGNKAEYCAVCGNPLEEKHPRCPKCGKEICPDCRVAGKNRCVACEKKAISDYRTAYQQLLLTTNGNIGAGGRQMMDQKARDLDMEDKKNAIEQELNAAYKPAPKAVQPDVVAPSAKKTVAPKEIVIGEKGMSAVAAAPTSAPKQSGGFPGWLWGVVIAVAIGGVFFFMNVGGDSAEPATEVKDTIVATPAAEPAKTQKATTTTAPAKAEAPAEKAQSTPEPVKEVVKDANYEAGMSAYDAGNGLDAVKAFNKSGSADAYYMLGLIYEQGCGTVGKNAMLARKNFKKAAELGSAAAKAKL